MAAVGPVGAGGPYAAPVIGGGPAIGGGAYQAPVLGGGAGGGYQGPVVAGGGAYGGGPGYVGGAGVGGVGGGAGGGYIAPAAGAGGFEGASQGVSGGAGGTTYQEGPAAIAPIAPQPQQQTFQQPSGGVAPPSGGATYQQVTIDTQQPVEASESVATSENFAPAPSVDTAPIETPAANVGAASEQQPAQVETVESSQTAAQVPAGTEAPKEESSYDDIIEEQQATDNTHSNSSPSTNDVDYANEAGDEGNCDDAELKAIVEGALSSEKDNLEAARKIESDAAAKFGGRFNAIVSDAEFAYVNWYGKRNCQLRIENRHSLTWED
ncbi:ground-like domain protein [Cooperia oncophora]